MGLPELWRANRAPVRFLLALLHSKPELHGGSAASPAPVPAPPAQAPEPAMRVTYELFRGTFKSWEALFDEAAQFASEIGPERLIGISHSEDENDGVIAV